MKKCVTPQTMMSSNAHPTVISITKVFLFILSSGLPFPSGLFDEAPAPVVAFELLTTFAEAAVFASGLVDLAVLAAAVLVVVALVVVLVVVLPLPVPFVSCKEPLLAADCVASPSDAHSINHRHVYNTIMSRILRENTFRQP